MQEQLRFYKQLFKKDDSQQCVNHCSLLNLNIPTLSVEDKSKCDNVLTMSECTAALKELPNNKSPGSDGFTSEFYKLFWSDIKCLVFNSFIYAFESGILSNDQRRAILTLLPKAGKDLRWLKNWRPLSLLNTDYKILTKALSIRLQGVLPKLVSEDQVAYIKGRQLGENCRKILDIFESTSTKIDPGFALFLDFEKAFDTVSRAYLFKTLQSFNFGESFCKWIRILYTSPLCSIINNGHSTESFETTRGIRQGCPISALLFILVAEIMAIEIRENNKIKGLSILDSSITLTQMADDTTLFLKDLESIPACLNVLNHFEKCAGLKLNKEKTEAFQLGINQIKIENMFGLKWVNGPIKVTGVSVGNNIAELSERMISEKVEKVKCLLNMWKSRNISIKGKITLLRTQAMPIILHLASILFISDENIKHFDSLFYDFIWPNKKHHVKKKVLIQNIEDGGLKMPDIESMIKAIKLTWIKKLLTKNNTFTDIAKAVTGIVNFTDFLKYKNDTNFLSNSIPCFYRQILAYWYELASRPPETAEKMIDEIIWNNKNLTINMSLNLM